MHDCMFVSKYTENVISWLKTTLFVFEIYEFSSTLSVQISAATSTFSGPRLCCRYSRCHAAPRAAVCRSAPPDSLWGDRGSRSPSCSWCCAGTLGGKTGGLSEENTEWNSGGKWNVVLIELFPLVHTLKIRFPFFSPSLCVVSGAVSGALQWPPDPGRPGEHVEQPARGSVHCRRRCLLLLLLWGQSSWVP